MKIKICGMRDRENIQAVAELQPDFLGFIFHKRSKRYVGADFAPDCIPEISAAIRKIGVFVNETVDQVIKIAARFDLEGVQLHGSETPADCRALAQAGLLVVKAFGVDQEFDARILEPYARTVDIFLFDNKCPEFGGSGLCFDWEKIAHLRLEKPFFLSGGIGLAEAAAIAARRDSLEMLYGIDCNSRLEIEPGMKDPEKVRAVIKEVRG